jgi:hypothetical protein
MTTFQNGSHAATAPVATSIASSLASLLGVNHEIVYLSSSDAAEWLERYKGPNRAISEIQVMRFQSDMESGRWHFEGAPLKISKTNRLQDGQHRLTALANCVPSVTLPFLVVTGLDEDAQLYMDQGQTRTVGQQLGLRGVANASRHAATAKLYLDWTRGRLFKSTREATSKPETAEWVLGHADLLSTLGETNFAQVDASPSTVGAFALAVLQMSPVRAFTFFSKLTSGAGLEEGDPILALDRRLRNIRRLGQKVSQRELLALFIKAWNGWVLGDRMLKIQVSNITEENFPQLVAVSDTPAI